jgi:type IV pilus assembly protein PilE
MRGFTLIEIMVVIAIVGVLFSVAIPIYQSNVLKTKRQAAQSCLMEYAQYMERYYTTNTTNPLSFTDATLSAAAACATSLTSAYAFTLSSTRSTYTLTATAKGAQVKDTDCIPLTLQQDGTKSPSSCWP